MKLYQSTTATDFHCDPVYTQIRFLPSCLHLPISSGLIRFYTWPTEFSGLRATALFMSRTNSCLMPMTESAASIIVRIPFPTVFWSWPQIDDTLPKLTMLLIKCALCLSSVFSIKSTRNQSQSYGDMWASVVASQNLRWWLDNSGTEILPNVWINKTLKWEDCPAKHPIANPSRFSYILGTKWKGLMCQVVGRTRLVGGGGGFLTVTISGLVISSTFKT